MGRGEVKCTGVDRTPIHTSASRSRRARLALLFSFPSRAQDSVRPSCVVRALATHRAYQFFADCSRTLSRVSKRPGEGPRDTDGVARHGGPDHFSKLSLTSVTTTTTTQMARTAATMEPSKADGCSGQPRRKKLEGVARLPRQDLSRRGTGRTRESPCAANQSGRRGCEYQHSSCS